MTPRRKPRETGLQNAIKDYLELRGCLVLRTNSGKVFPKHGGAVQLCPEGTADLNGMLPGGRFFAFEVKMPGKKPTEEQEFYLATVYVMGGHAGWGTSIEDAQTFYEEGVK